MTTTVFSIAGYEIVKNLGVVRGITVRSRSVVGNFFAGLKSLIGGRIGAYISLCEKTREEAFEEMLKHADALGANAVIGIKYDANEVATGITEVLAYGTAVVVKSRF